MSSLTFCHPVILQFLVAAIFFLTDCKELKVAQTAEINQLFSFLNLIGIYGYIFYGLTCMIMSKNVNNDVTMNPPMQDHINIVSLVVTMHSPRMQIL